MVTIDRPVMMEEHMQAWNNWWEFWAQERGEKYRGHDDPIGGYPHFEQFMGQSIFNGKPLSPEAVHRLRLLLSPHHYAILKAYKAKQEVT